MTPLGQVLVLAVTAALAWLVLAGRAVFVITVRDGRARVTRGMVSGLFLADVEDVCRDHGIRSGTVRGVRRGRRVALDFSRSIPAPTRQRLRNAWQNQAPR